MDFDIRWVRDLVGLVVMVRNMLLSDGWCSVILVSLIFVLLIWCVVLMSICMLLGVGIVMWFELGVSIVLWCLGNSELSVVMIVFRFFRLWGIIL